MAVKVLRVEGMREDTRSPEERKSLEAAEAQPLDMSVRPCARRGAGSNRSRRLRIDGLHRAARPLARRGRGRPQRVEDPQGELRCAVCEGGGQPTADPALLVGQPVVARRGDRPADQRVALPRSGSTHLENLVAADRRLRHLPVYLAAQPAPQPGEAPEPDGIDPRWARSAARWEVMSQNQIMSAMHEHSPGHACGENELQIPDFASYQWEWLANVPGFRDYYLSHDQTPHYRVHARRSQAPRTPVPERAALDAEVQPAQRAARPALDRLPRRHGRDDPPGPGGDAPVAAHDAWARGRRPARRSRTSTPTSTTGSRASSACCGPTCVTGILSPTISWSR